MKIYIIPMVLFFLASPLYAVGLQEVVQEALQNNKNLKALRFQVEAKQVGYDVAGAWQAPSLGITQFGDAIETKLGPQDQVISLKQKIPAFGETDQKIKIAEFTFQRAQMQLELSQRNLQEKVSQLYIQIWKNEKLLALYQKNQKLLNRLVELGGAEGSANLTVLGQVFQSEALGERNAYEVLDVQEKIERGRMELNYLLGRTSLLYGEKIQRQESPAKLESLEKLAVTLTVHPKVKIKELELSIAVSRQNLAELRSFSPSFVIGLNYIQVSPGSSVAADKGKDANSISLGMSIPFGNAKLKGDAGVRLQQVKAAEQSLENEKAWLTKELAQRHSTYRQALRKKALYREQLIPQAKKRKDLAERLYSTGRNKAVQIMEMQLRLLEMHIGEVKVEAESMISKVALEWLLKRGIK